MGVLAIFDLRFAFFRESQGCYWVRFYAAAGKQDMVICISRFTVRT